MQECGWVPRLFLVQPDHLKKKLENCLNPR